MKIIVKEAELKEGIRIAGVEFGQMQLNFLSNRGYSSKKEIEEFLEKKDLDDFKDELPDQKLALDIIHRAITTGDSVVFWGDYDVDGASCLSIAERFATETEMNFSLFTSNRFTEGYGMNEASVKRFLETYPDVKIVITMDNGITSVDAIKTLKDRGITVLITDHHEPLDILPEADAIVNPKRRDSTYPFKELCGAAVIYKLFLAYAEQISDDIMLDDFVKDLIDYVTMATVADIVPLQDENRALVIEGLKKMHKRPIPFISRFLKEKKGSTVTAQDIAFGIAPMLNSFSRMNGHMDNAVKMLTAENLLGVEEYFIEGMKTNEIRKALVSLHKKKLPRGCTVPTIHIDNEASHGIVGILASEVVEDSGVPCIVLGKNQAGQYTGSARTIDGISMIEFLDSCKDILVKYGGHDGAGGLTVEPEHVEDLSRRFASIPMPVKPNEEIFYVDASVTEVSDTDMMQFAYMEPFGKGFESPFIAMEDIEYIDRIYMGKTMNTVKFITDKIDILLFDRKEVDYPQCGKVTAVGTVNLNHYNGKTTTQFLADKVFI